MQDQLSENNSIPHCPVSFWEIILILIGAIALMGVGLIGLGMKMLNNMLNPIRAEAVAKNLVDYDIPGGSHGVVGVNIGAEKFAIIKSNTNPPDILLFVSKVPTDTLQDETPITLGDVVALEDSVSGKFIPNNTSEENQQVCAQNVPVTIQQGQQTFENHSPLAAILYSAKTTENGFERTINILATGKNAKDKAIKVLLSLECK
jgi:hypothetical protein